MLTIQLLLNVGNYNIEINLIMIYPHHPDDFAKSGTSIQTENLNVDRSTKFFLTFVKVGITY